MRGFKFSGRLTALFLFIAVLVGVSSRQVQGGTVQTLPRVAVFAGDASSRSDDVKSKLQGTGLFSQVDTIDIRSVTPTLTDLQQYDAVLVYSYYAIASSSGLGDVLADYVDGGGGVVLAAAALDSNALFGVAGRMETDNYLPFTRSSFADGGNLTLVKDEPTHPILQSVISFTGGDDSDHHPGLALTAGTMLVAHWSNNEPLVAAKQLVSGRVVGLNFVPVSSDVASVHVPTEGWDPSTDGARLMANSLLWSAKLTPPVAYNLSVANIRTDRARVAWLTNEPVRNSVVEYGPTPALGSSVPSADGTGGVATLTGLQAGKTYYFRLRSTTQAGTGVEGTSELNSFITVPAGAGQKVGVFLVREGSELRVYLTLDNGSGVAMNNLRITRGSLRGSLGTANTSTSPLPALGNVAPGGTATALLVFPDTVGNPGEPLTLSVGWSSSAGSGSGSFRVVFPGEVSF